MSEETEPWALVVDDDVLILMDATDILELAGFRVLEAQNVDEALHILEDHHSRLRLLFTDVHMPGRHDGFHLARVVSRCWPDISIVIASGQATPGLDDIPEGATFIPKPFSAEVVHETLRQTIPVHQQPEPLQR